MRIFVCVMLVVFLPLTLASQTQDRFLVCVMVDGKDETTTLVLTSLLKRELRALGDVDIVGSNEDWLYWINIVYIKHENQSGRKTGNLSIANTVYKRVPQSYFTQSFLNQFDAVSNITDGSLLLKLTPAFTVNVGLSIVNNDNLQEWCIMEAGDFNDSVLKMWNMVR